ncbi:hypothetical protein HK100_000610 [Physocladia obscura]|uniref:MHYT domain-containing protein n=1 Tax=Physocladia obscura TaxID=109957 RepID=A0AAD5XBP7_9FUNG|nr:hypothetical protein HK100_000610 [Physocladia obscura]
MNQTALSADGDLLEARWNWVTILISFAISYAGAMYTILFNETRARTDPPHSKEYSRLLLAISAFSVSIRAIFFMHFIGMTAITLYVPGTEIEVPIYFDLNYTVLSAIICILVVTGAFFFVAQDEFWNDIVHERGKIAEKILAQKIAKTFKKKPKFHFRDKFKKKKPASHAQPSLPVIPSSIHELNYELSDDEFKEQPLPSKQQPEIQSRKTEHPQIGSSNIRSNSVRRTRENQTSRPVSANLDSDSATKSNQHQQQQQNPENVALLASPHEDNLTTSLTTRSFHQENMMSLEGRSHQHLQHLASGQYLSHIANMQSVSRLKKTQSHATNLTESTIDELEIEILILFEKPWRIVASGIAIAIAVLAMHHLGMYSMRMEATQHFNTGIVALSVVIAVVAATAGMFIIFRILPFYPNDILKMVAAFIIAVAVNGMHYTGMAALSFKYRHNANFDSSGLIYPVYLGDAILYSEVIINIISEAMLRFDNTEVLSLLRARTRAFAGSLNYLDAASTPNPESILASQSMAVSSQMV